MKVIAMRTVEVKKHPNADSLMVYRFESPGLEDGLQIVANMENVYEVGDLAYVALIGCVLKDGTKISKANIRGIESYGMALGLCEKMDAEPGNEFTSHYCLQPDDVSVVKWPSIEGLHHIRKGVKRRQKDDPSFIPPVVSYYAKVKLHGTNAGVQVLKNGSVIAQSRTRILTPGDDNHGFAAWVGENREYFKNIRVDDDIIIFGEWVGTGIMKGVAVSDIGRKVFVVFAVQFGLGRESKARIMMEPIEIGEILSSHSDVFILPWYSAPGVVLDWNNKNNLELNANQVNIEVDKVERLDPWVKKVFDVSGTGEGLVMYPTSVEGDDLYVQYSKVGKLVDCDMFSELIWKAKGEKHKVVKQKNPAQVDPEVAKNIEDFVDMFMTDARLNQGRVEACAGDFDTQFTGGFIKWMVNDVKKESEAELEASGLSWSQVSKSIGNKAREWYLEKAREL